MKFPGWANDNLASCAYMATAMFGYVVNDALVRQVGQTVPIGQIILIRNTLLVVLLALIVHQRGLWYQIKHIAERRVALRSFFELFATLTFLYALMRVPFANTAAILQCLPLAVALGAVFFFRERVGVWRWSAIVIGFIGVLIIVRPGMSGFTPASLWLLVTVAFAAGRDLLARTFPDSLATSIVALSTACIIAIAGAVMVFLQDAWVPISWINILRLVTAALFLTTAYLCIVQTMRVGEISVSVFFRYTSLLWAIFFGWLLFDELPDALTLTGSALVISMGALTLYRESYLRRRATENATHTH